MVKNKITIVEDYVKSIMGSKIAHDFKHVDRVRRWALNIAKNENFTNLNIVEAAALLHDIGMSKAEKTSEHGEIGAKMAVEFLNENKLFTGDEIAEIGNAVRHHNKNREGAGKLLEIIRDADMIDMFGAVGLMRAFTSKSLNPDYNPAAIKGQTWGMTAKDFDKRFNSGVGVGSFITDQINFQISCYDNLSTDYAKEIAKPLVNFMIDYQNELETEILG